MLRRDARVRGWQVQPRTTRKGRKEAPKKAASGYVIIFDTETTAGLDQRLNFGVYELGKWKGDKLKIFQKGFFVAEDLQGRDPEGLAVLEAFCAEHHIRVRTRREFVREVLLRYGHRGGAEIVGFNLKFDLARLAIHHGPGRKKNKGGFSFALDKALPEDLDQIDQYLPRIACKTQSSTTAFTWFSHGRGTPNHLRRKGQGRFVELRAVLFALSNKKHSLASAAEAWQTKHRKAEFEDHGVISTEGLHYAIQDVVVTRELYLKAREEVSSLPIQIDLCDIYSPASLSKAFLEAINLARPLEQFDLPEEAFQVSMEAFYGGRSEVRRRLEPTRVLYADFLSMYPSVNALLDMWPILTAQRLKWVEATETCQEILDQLEPEDFFDSRTWPRLKFFGGVRPDRDILPLRTDFEGRAPRIGQCEVSSDVVMHYGGPDLAASKVLTGRAPQLTKAWKLVPVGVQQGLKRIELPDGRVLDPTSHDLFKALIELRKSLPKNDPDTPRVSRFLKVVANSGGYGVFAEFHREPEKSSVRLAGHEGEISAFLEEPGKYCLPPVAAWVTGGARLPLAMLEREVLVRGGSHVFCDTDSMAIAMESGGASVQDVLEIVQKFERLKPYDPDLVKDTFLELESQNFDAAGNLDPPLALAISAKRYALYRDREVIKHSEHGLGLYKSPISDPGRDWMTEFWVWALAWVRGEEAEFPDWVDRLLVSDYTANTPDLLRVFENGGIPLQPFGFILVGYVDQPGVYNSVVRVCAPFEKDPAKWVNLDWVDAHSGEAVRVAQNRPPVYEAEVRLRTFRDLIRDYIKRPETSAVGVDGLRCQANTIGPLFRPTVRVTGKVWTGKEGHELEKAEVGLNTQPGDLCQVYDARLSPSVTEKIRLDPEGAAAASGVSRDYLVKKVLTGKRSPSRETRDRLVLWAQDQDGVSTPAENVTNAAGENVTPGGGDEPLRSSSSPSWFCESPSASGVRSAAPQERRGGLRRARRGDASGSCCRGC